MKAIPFAQIRDEALADPAVKAEYDRLAEEYAEARAAIAALAEAKEKGMKPLSQLLAELDE
jgi:phytoene/squalene synthetase